jgi:hypothetical protein
MADQAIEALSMSHKELVDSIAAIAQPFLHLECAGGKLYLGSMFYMDFGNIFDTTSRRGRKIKIGEMTLSVRDVVWSLFDSGVKITDAESVDTDVFDRAICRFMGKRIIGLLHRPDLGQLEISFGAELYFLVDLTNKWKSDGDVVELALPDGRRVAISNSGKLVVDTELDRDRAENWSQSSH